jgi:hypothetical protein
MFSRRHKTGRKVIRIFSLSIVLLVVAFILLIYIKVNQGNGVNDILDGIAVDCHSHTQRSLDGDWTLEENLNWHGDNGFNGVFLTEHVSFNNPLPWQCYTLHMMEWNYNHPDGPFALPGCEITTFSFHVLMLGINYWDMRVPPAWNNSAGEFGLGPLDDQGVQTPDITNTIDDATMLQWLTEAISRCHALGGVAILAHPTVYSRFTFEQFLEAGIDGIETRNSACGPYYYQDWANDTAANNLTATAGSDWHSQHETIRCYTKLPDSATSPELMIQAVKDGNTLSLEYPHDE